MNCDAAYKCSSLAVLVERLEPLTPKWGHNVGFRESYRTERKPRQYTWYFPPNERVFALGPSAERIDLTGNSVTRAVVASVDIQGETIADIEYGFDRLAYAIKGTKERDGYIDAQILEAFPADQDISATIECWTARVAYSVLIRAQDPNPGEADSVAFTAQMNDPNGDLVGEVEVG